MTNSDGLSMGDSTERPPHTVEGALLIRRRDEGDIVLLSLSGALDLGSLLAVRDAAFTAIGARPRLLCMDVLHVRKLEIGAIKTLVTISRVARLVKVGFCLRAAAPVVAMLDSTGLSHALPPAERLAPDLKFDF